MQIFRDSAEPPEDRESLDDKGLLNGLHSFVHICHGQYGGQKAQALYSTFSHLCSHYHEDGSPQSQIKRKILPSKMTVDPKAFIFSLSKFFPYRVVK